MAEGNSYKEVLSEVRDRLGGIDGRLEGIDERLANVDDRITTESAATRQELTDLREKVNEEQTKQSERLGMVEKYVTLRSAIERALVWGIGTLVTVAGIAAGLIKFVLS